MARRGPRVGSRVRQLRAQELAEAHGIKRAEDLNQSLRDWETRTGLLDTDYSLGYDGAPRFNELPTDAVLPYLFRRTYTLDNSPNTGLLTVKLNPQATSRVLRGDFFRYSQQEADVIRRSNPDSIFAAAADLASQKRAQERGIPVKRVDLPSAPLEVKRQLEKQLLFNIEQVSEELGERLTALKPSAQPIRGADQEIVYGDKALMKLSGAGVRGRRSPMERAAIMDVLMDDNYRGFSENPSVRLQPDFFVFSEPLQSYVRLSHPLAADHLIAHNLDPSLSNTASNLAMINARANTKKNPQARKDMAFEYDLEFTADVIRKDVDLLAQVDPQGYQQLVQKLDGLRQEMPDQADLLEQLMGYEGTTSIGMEDRPPLYGHNTIDGLVDEPPPDVTPRYTRIHKGELTSDLQRRAFGEGYPMFRRLYT